MTIQAYKDKEIQKIIEQAFEQFNITNISEKQEIANAIKQQLNTSKSLSNFEESIHASSGKYRADVRAALIDIISQLLHIKDMENKLGQTEALSRDTIESAKNRLIILESKFHNLKNDIYESFEEGVNSGQHNGTVIKDEKLRVDKAVNQIAIKQINSEIHPATNNVNDVVVETSDNLEVLLQSGLLTDSYQVSVSTPSEPSLYIGGGFLPGVVVSFDIETDSTQPVLFSAKASTPFRIQAVYAGTSADNYTTNLGRDRSLGTYSFVETTAENMYTHFRVYLYFPDHILDNDFYKYNFNIHNLKIFNKPAEQEIMNGTFISNTYEADKPILGAKIDATFTGNVNFKLNFENTDTEQYVIPNGTLRTFITYINSEENPDISLEPFKIKDSSTLSVRDIDQNSMEFDILGSYMGIRLTGSFADYVGYVFIEYETYQQVFPEMGYLSPKPDEVYLNKPQIQTEYYDGVEPYTMQLSKVPFIFAKELELANFIFYNNDEPIPDIEDLTDGDNSDTVFSIDTDQFYYKDQVLYTNFQLTDYDKLYVKYRFMCNGITLTLDLFDNATVNDYHLDLITLDEFSHNTDWTENDKLTQS